jgi:hypothetical protein
LHISSVLHEHDISLGKPKSQSSMDNPEIQATFCKIHIAKNNFETKKTQT